VRHTADALLSCAHAIKALLTQLTFPHLLPAVSSIPVFPPPVRTLRKASSRDRESSGSGQAAQQQQAASMMYPPVHVAGAQLLYESPKANSQPFQRHGFQTSVGEEVTSASATAQQQRWPRQLALYARCLWWSTAAAGSANRSSCYVFLSTEQLSLNCMPAAAVWWQTPHCD
jgi:hypothetical protein